MNSYKILNDRKRSSFSKIIAIIFGAALFMTGLLLGSPLGVIVGPVLIWSALFVKYTIVNDEGIVVNYDARVFKYQEQWLYDEITNIHRESNKDPSYSILHFTKGFMSKRLVFQKSDGQNIIDLALTKNKKIHFDEAT